MRWRWPAVWLFPTRHVAFRSGCLKKRKTSILPLPTSNQDAHLQKLPSHAKKSFASPPLSLSRAQGIDV